MKKLVMLFLLGSCLISAGAVQWSQKDVIESPKNKSSKIQLALLLDTSNSMDGLIDQAKAKLWAIVNDMADNQLNGELLDIEIAIYDYGNSNNSILKQYTHQYSNFTTDIDDISEKLFSLTTSGGDEFCGAVIQKSLNDLEWRDDAAYKVMFIAGNESFAQGPILFESVIAAAREKDVVVNTIFCGGTKQGIQLQWQEGALRGNGEFFVINQNEAVTYIETPQDKKIAALNRRLNETYIPYGEEGTNKYNKLKDQDKNASKYGASNMATRTMFKSKKQYNNASWDLIDAYEQSNAIIEKTAQLPETFKQLSMQEREDKIIKMKESRKQIKEEINKLSQERKSHINTVKSKTKSNDLGDSMSKSLQRQMNKRGIHKK